MLPARYRIQAVATLAGVPAATLRSWERRYGVPRPARTRSAYRLYSEEDLWRVRRMRELSEGGLAAAEAAGAVLQQMPPPRGDVAQSPYEAASDALVAAAGALDPEALEAALREATELGSALQVVEGVLSTALFRIGELWHQGSLTTAHEHLASELIGNHLRSLLRLVQPSEGHSMALLACFADEEHVLPLYLAAFRFVDWGCRVRVLGARTPPAALATAVAQLKPSVVGLSLTAKINQARAKELFCGYADACGCVPWIVGGASAPRWQALIEANGGRWAGSDPEAMHRALQGALTGRGA